MRNHSIDNIDSKTKGIPEELYLPRRYHITTTTDLDPEIKDKFLNLFVFGCHGEGTPAQTDVADLMNQAAAKNKPDFNVILGDNFYDYGVDSPEHNYFETLFYNIYHSQSVQHIRNIPSFVALGNHDYNYQHKAKQYLKKASDLFSFFSKKKTNQDSNLHQDQDQDHIQLALNQVIHTSLHTDIYNNDNSGLILIQAEPVEQDIEKNKLYVYKQGNELEYAALNKDTNQVERYLITKKELSEDNFQAISTSIDEGKEKLGLAVEDALFDVVSKHGYNTPLNYQLNTNDLPKWNMPSRFYSLYHQSSSTELFALDSNRIIKDYLAYLKNPNIDADLNQFKWLLTRWYDSKATKKMVAMHHPLDTFGKRAFTDDKSIYELDAEDLSTLKEQRIEGDNYNRLIQKLFHKYNIQPNLTLAAHDHCLYYSPNQAIIGGGGGKLQHRVSMYDLPFFAKDYGFAQLTVTKNDIFINYHLLDGKVIKIRNSDQQPEIPKFYTIDQATNKKVIDSIAQVFIHCVLDAYSFLIDEGVYGGKIEPPQTGYQEEIEQLDNLRNIVYDQNQTNFEALISKVIQHLKAHFGPHFIVDKINENINRELKLNEMEDAELTINILHEIVANPEKYNTYNTLERKLKNDLNVKSIEESLQEEQLQNHLPKFSTGLYKKVEQKKNEHKILNPKSTQPENDNGKSNNSFTQ